jgi:predicted ATPase
MNEHYRKALKQEEKKMKNVKHELDQMRKQEEHLLKVAEQKKKEAAIVKRRLTKEKRKLELSKVVPRRSSRLARKKRTRCPNGTRRNQKSGQCEKKSAKTRKRCPNGTHKNKKSGKCE